MAKNKISEYSATSANNTDISNINIAEGCSPANVNNAIRTLMAQLKDQQDGTSGDPFTVGGNLVVTGTTTFTGGLASALSIANGGTGSTTASGARTNLSAAASGANSDITSLTGITAGTATAPAFTTTGDTNTGMFFPAADTIAFSDGGAEAMRIDSSGNVRINNTGGIDGLFSCLTGANYAGAFVNTDATYTTVYSWNKATSGNNLFYSFYTEAGATIRGTIDYNRAANQVRYNTTSDQRLKENIVDAPSATDLINSVKIRSFDWKETGFHVDYGVIAQELNEVVPDAVSEGLDNEDGTIKQAWGVDTSVLVPALVKAIQEQQTIINDLKARIETLEAK